MKWLVTFLIGLVFVLGGLLISEYLKDDAHGTENKADTLKPYADIDINNTSKLIKTEEKGTFNTVTMSMQLEKKDHHVELGKYQKMWVIGSNVNDDDPNKERYKIMIDDSRIYNLLEEGNQYFVLIQGERKYKQAEYTYTFGQLGLPEGTQLVGKGIID